MRPSLRGWIADADTRRNIDHFGLQSEIPGLAYQEGRQFDLYLSLVGELFDFLREGPTDLRDWATLGNALVQTGEQLEGAAQRDALFMAAASFYSGGYSASAYVAMSQAGRTSWPSETFRACYDFMARPRQMSSEGGRRLLEALAVGDVDAIGRAGIDADEAASSALNEGPDEWVAARVYSALIDRFQKTNLRAVLPDGTSQRWDPLVRSLMNRSRPVWDFFPSQIAAIQAGLLSSNETFSLQMPTGAGKTALTETLLFNHLIDRPGELAVLLVPYRALARELRGSIGGRLTQAGLPTRTVYGGTVPTHEEVRDLDELSALIATPESLTGLLGNAPELLSRISLIVCDEGHLLSQPGRGVGLELLLARFRGRGENRPRMVFVSAIVPNIEEVNAWLGGSERSVVRSDFRPAEAEYALLRPSGKGAATRVGLEMHAVDSSLPAHTLSDFLHPNDFRFTNLGTGRSNNYAHESVKAQAIAAARKSLALGTVAVFSTMKRGNQGVVGLASELLNQLDRGIPLPRPLDAVRDTTRIDLVAEYLGREYGDSWLGTRCLRAGAIVHHGDIPQETREAVEELLIDGAVRMVLCTGTLAEGVNLPIRTLVLYAIQRQTEGGVEPMLARDIQNLVGRAGRAGSSTRGLVILANPKQWGALEPVIAGEPGEDVRGSLLELVERLQRAIRGGARLTNPFLERYAELYSMTDGIDSTLLELLHDEVGAEQFHDIAAGLAAHTFASQQMNEQDTDLLAQVFTLRASRLIELRERGRLSWVTETGARVRLVDSVVGDLAPRLSNWAAVTSPLDPALIEAFLSWAYQQADFQRDLNDGFPERELIPPENLTRQTAVQDILVRWLAGASFAEIAESTSREVDEVLRIYGTVISFSLSTLVEQAVAVLERHLAETEVFLSEPVTKLAEHLRYGVPVSAARALLATGLRHRRAGILLGGHPAMTDPQNAQREPRDIARDVIAAEEDWLETLGLFVYERTLVDLGVEPSSQAGGGASRDARG